MFKKTENPNRWIWYMFIKQKIKFGENGTCLKKQKIKVGEYGTNFKVRKSTSVNMVQIWKSENPSRWIWYMFEKQKIQVGEYGKYLKNRKSKLVKMVHVKNQKIKIDENGTYLKNGKSAAHIAANYHSNLLIFRWIYFWILLYQLKSDCIYHYPMIRNQTEFRLVLNQSENGKYNLISVDLTRIESRFLFV